MRRKQRTPPNRKQRRALKKMLQWATWGAVDGNSDVVDQINQALSQSDFRISSFAEGYWMVISRQPFSMFGSTEFVSGDFALVCQFILDALNPNPHR